MRSGSSGRRAARGPGPETHSSVRLQIVHYRPGPISVRTTNPDDTPTLGPLSVSRCPSPLYVSGTPSVAVSLGLVFPGKTDLDSFPTDTHDSPRQRPEPGPRRTVLSWSLSDRDTTSTEPSCPVRRYRTPTPFLSDRVKVRHVYDGPDAPRPVPTVRPKPHRTRTSTSRGSPDLRP